MNKELFFHKCKNCGEVEYSVEVLSCANDLLQASEGKVWNCEFNDYLEIAYKLINMGYLKRPIPSEGACG